jgi:hypothetical protein
MLSRLWPGSRRFDSLLVPAMTELLSARRREPQQDADSFVGRSVAPTTLSAAKADVFVGVFV